MTEPTDAELDELRQANSGRLNFVTLSEFRTIARAVLAKWGQPTHSGEPVAWLNPWRADQVTTDYDAYGEHGTPLYTAPQPSPAAQGDALDAARLDWLLLHISGAEFRRIGVHYSGNASRADVDAARKQGANHD